MDADARTYDLAAIPFKLIPDFNGRVIVEWLADMTSPMSAPGTAPVMEVAYENEKVAAHDGHGIEARTVARMVSGARTRAQERVVHVPFKQPRNVTDSALAQQIAQFVHQFREMEQSVIGVMRRRDELEGKLAEVTGEKERLGKKVEALERMRKNKE